MTTNTINANVESQKRTVENSKAEEHASFLPCRSSSTAGVTMEEECNTPDRGVVSGMAKEASCDALHDKPSQMNGIADDCLNATAINLSMETNKAPWLASFEMSKLVRWWQDYLKYIRRGQDAARSGHIAEWKPRSVASMVDEYMLEIVCGAILKTDSSNVTDEQLLSWVKQTISGGNNKDEHIDRIMNDLVMNMNITGGQARTLDFAMQFKRLAGENGVSNHFQTPAGMKMKIRYLQNGVRPKRLQERMATLMKYNQSLKDDPEEYLSVLMVKAIAHDEFFGSDDLKITRKAAKPANERSEQFNSGSRKPKPQRRAAEANPVESNTRKRNMLKVTCLKCSQSGHFMSNCPDNPSQEEQKTLLAKHRSLSKRSKFSDRFNTGNSKPYIVQMCRLGRAVAKTVEDTVEISAENDINASSQIEVRISMASILFPGILDSGAAATVVPMRIASKAMKMDPTIRLNNLEEKVVLKLPDGSKAEATHEMHVDLTLQTSTGELIIRGRRCLVWDTPSEEIFIGEDLLQEIGIDPKRALEHLILNAPKNEDGTPEQDQLLKTIPDDDVNIGKDIPSDIANGIDEMIQRAIHKGLPSMMQRKVEILVKRYANIWRRSLGPDPPAKVTPFRTNLKSGAEPVRCKARRYNNEQSEFLAQFVALLEKYGLVYENQNSEWASPVVVVRKPGARGLRMCVDLREVNAACKATAWPMPFLESIVRHLAGSKYWFSLDAFKGFWIMPLDKECQEMFSFMTDRGVYTPTRSIQGALNSSTQFQSRMHAIYKDLLYKSLIIWIDDILGHADTEEKWFAVLENTLTAMISNLTLIGATCF